MNDYTFPWRPVATIMLMVGALSYIGYSRCNPGLKPAEDTLGCDTSCSDCAFQCMSDAEYPGQIKCEMECAACDVYCEAED